jgi:hypothetical protein
MSEKRRFQRFIGQNAQKHLFFQRFSLFRIAVKVSMTSRNLSITNPWLGTPPSISRHTKQFWSRLHGL